MLRPLLLGSAILACAASLAQPARDGLFPYRAVYGLHYGDKRVGESVFVLSYDSTTGHYAFETHSELRGLLRFTSPRPVIERSEFAIVENQIRPLAFTYQDGSRRGGSDLFVRFDRESGHLIVERDGMSEKLPLIPDALDRASARVALMRELGRSQLTSSYGIADPDVIRTYDNRNEGTETLTTPFGKLTAQKISQQRRESSRRTVTWAARELHFLPIRVEQRREGHTPVAFVLESVEWLTDAEGREDSH